MPSAISVALDLTAEESNVALRPVLQRNFTLRDPNLLRPTGSAA
jgi:hypothetical protein